jgi:hypothetical protein
VIGAIAALDPSTLLPFALGALLGLGTIARLLDSAAAPRARRRRWPRCSA